MFRFKQFSIDHSQAAMKVGTDAVLLGAWASVNGANTLLDIGCGSGVIALMLAQRTGTTAHIDAVEVREADAQQAQLNVLRSPWPQKIEVHCVAIQEFNPGKSYDCIVTNPPFFTNSYLPPDPGRLTARHDKLLPFDELIEKSASLLKPSGKLNVILPDTEATTLTTHATTWGLHLSRRCRFVPKKNRRVERLLLEFGFDDGDCIETELIHYDDLGEWTSGYKELTRDFYLKL